MRPWHFAVFALLLNSSALAFEPDRPMSMPQALAHFAAAKSIPVVVVCIGRAESHLQPSPVLDGKSLKDALQIIGAAYSNRPLPAATQPLPEALRETLIPYEFPRVWTIARDRQWQYLENPEVRDILAATSPRILLDHAVRSLSDAQLRLATITGLPYSELSTGQKAVLSAAFVEPVALLHTTGTPPAPGDPILEKVPVEQCVLRLHLSFRDFHFVPGPPSENTAVDGDISLETGEPEIAFQPKEGASGSYSYRVVTTVPSRLKPGDLLFDAEPLTAPIGVSGFLPLSKAVEAAERTSHLALRVDPRFDHAAPVFIGDPKLRTGDVLRTIAFDVQGAWRKVGGVYILTFERTTYGRRSAAWRTRLDALDATRDSLLNDAVAQPAGDVEERMMRILQPDPDGPIGPTPDQKDLMLKGEVTGSSRRPGCLLYSDLNAIQKAEVNRRMQADHPDWPDPESPEMLLRWARLMIHDLTVRMTLDTPAHGRIRVGSLTRVQPLGIIIGREARQVSLEPVPATVSLPARAAALAIAPMPVSEYPRLFAQMQRKGIRTLYLPVFWNGCTLYPSHQFPPLDPARETDALRDVLALAARSKVKVIAELNVLAWRNPGGRDSHWLTKQPNLVDVDAAGSGRRAWTQAHLAYLADHENFDFGHLLNDDALLFSDVVRPNEPDVRSRLLGVLEELKAYPALNGIALAEWCRVSSQRYSNNIWGSHPGPPDLGFGDAEREAFIREHGVDPADLVGARFPFADVPTFRLLPHESDLSRAWAAVRRREDAALLHNLIDAAEKAWPGHVHIFSPLDETAELPAIPTRDITVHVGGTGATSGHAWLSVSPMPDIIDSLPNSLGNVPDRLADMLRRITDMTADQTRGGSPPSGIVLDFRAAPKLLWDGLARLAGAKPAF